MPRVEVPNNYPKGCSDDSIKKVVEQCQNQINSINKSSDQFMGTNYYYQVAEQGNAELERRLDEKLILNLKKSSKRQRELTWAIIIIGGLNLILATWKIFKV